MIIYIYIPLDINFLKIILFFSNFIYSSALSLNQFKSVQTFLLWEKFKRFPYIPKSACSSPAYCCQVIIGDHN